MKLTGIITGTVEVAISGSFVVDEAYLPRRVQQQLVEQATKSEWDAKALNSQGTLGDMRVQTDVVKLNRERLRKLLPTAHGLTEAIFLELIEFTDDDRELDVRTDADGNIAWDHDHVALVDEVGEGKDKRRVEYTVPMLLWSFAPQARFANVIDAVQRRWHELKAAADEAKKKTSETSAK